MKRGCTQCGECLNVCPVFRQHHKEEYSPKGKRILMEPVDNGVSDMTWNEVFGYARLCAGCGRCKKACARKLSTADLLADIRAKHPHWSQHVWELWIKHMGPLWPSIGYLANLVPEKLTPQLLASSVATAKALARDKNIHPWTRLKPSAQTPEDTSTVVLFPGCTARYVRPQWTEKAEDLLRYWGYTLLDASVFGCCGGTMHHAGQYKTMNEMRAVNIEAWRVMGRPRIAVFCASCCHSLLEYAEGPLEGDEAKEWKKKLVPVSALLTNPKVAGTGAKPDIYGYHQPCHWDKDSDMPFLASIMPGLKKGTALCCGMGGILKMTDPDLSNDMAATCLQGFAEGVTDIVTGCSGCAMQLSGAAGDGMAVYHWLDLVERQ